MAKRKREVPLIVGVALVKGMKQLTSEGASGLAFAARGYDEC